MKAKDYDAMVESARRQVERIRRTFREEYQHLSPAERVELLRAIDGGDRTPQPPAPIVRAYHNTEARGTTRGGGI